MSRPHVQHLTAIYINFIRYTIGINPSNIHILNLSMHDTYGSYVQKGNRKMSDLTQSQSATFEVVSHLDPLAARDSCFGELTSGANCGM